MTEALTWSEAWQRFGSDPVLFYSACAALILVLVSLGTGLARGDVLVLAKPKVALRVLGAVALGFLLQALAQRLTGASPPWVAAAANGVAAVPVLVVTLAYGPSIGLLTGALFAPAVARGAFPGLHEAFLTLELVILGWLAIYPSPRTARWAGPLNALVAGALTWGTAGTALLAFSGQAIQLQDLLAMSGSVSAETVATVALLFAVGPAAYARLFPGSRIAPTAPAHEASRPPDQTRHAEPWDTLATAEWAPPPRQRAELVAPAAAADDPNA